MNQNIFDGVSYGFAHMMAIALLALAATSLVWSPGAEAASPLKALKGAQRAAGAKAPAGAKASAGARRHAGSHAGHRGRAGVPTRQRSPAATLHSGAHRPTAAGHRAGAPAARRDTRRDGVRFDKSPVQRSTRGVTFRDPITRTAGVPPRARAPVGANAPSTIPGTPARLPAAGGPAGQARAGAPRANVRRPGAVNLTPANRRSGGAASTAVTASTIRPDTTSPNALKSRLNSAGGGRVSTYGPGVPVAVDNAKQLTEHAKKIVRQPLPRELKRR